MQSPMFVLYMELCGCNKKACMISAIMVQASTSNYDEGFRRHALK